MRSIRGGLAFIVVCSLLVVVVAGSGLGAPTTTATPNDGAATHTLVIASTNGSGTYSVTASESLRLTNGEQSDYQLRGSRASGTVGGKGDAKDVIRYTGSIETIQVDGAMQVTLDGRQIDPHTLAGQYLRITRQNNTTQPIRYQVNPTGRVSRGELAEQNDTMAKGAIRGRVRDEADSVYFTGDLSSKTLSVTGPAQITINGQNASVFLTHAPPTPTPSPSPTRTRTSSPTTAHSPSPTPSSPTPSTYVPTSDGDSDTSTDAGRASLVDQLLRFVGGLITGIAALIAVLYLFLRE